MTALTYLTLLFITLKRGKKINFQKWSPWMTLSAKDVIYYKFNYTRSCGGKQSILIR